MKRWALTAVFMGWSALSWGQCDSLIDWAPKEARWWADFKNQTQHWQWTPDLERTLKTAVCECAMGLGRISARMAAAEAEGGPGLTDSLTLFQTEQDRIRQLRDAAFLAAVPMAWWPEMQAVLHPPKPTVLHFGVHDRMKCTVCVPGSAE